MTLALILLLLLLALLGLPLFLVILGVTLGGQAQVQLPAAVVFVEIFDKITENPVFMTIPLFAHAGFVLSHGKAPERLVELSRAALGWMPGGSALVAIVTCALFTAFTGASGVTIIALGGLLLPLLARERYPERFNLGLVTTGGSLGLLFPPSLPLIVYALIASNIAPVPVGALFLAGIVPGLLLMAVLALYGSWTGQRHSTRERIPFEPRRLARSLVAAVWELPIPVIIFWGFFGGWLTIAQVAAVVALYVSLVELFAHRDLTLADFLRVTTRSMVLVGGILVIIMAALAMTNFLTDQEVPAAILASMEERLTSKVAFLLALNGFLLVIGCLMDIYSAILVVIPLVLPIALRFGIDPVHLGVILLTNLEIGYSTPPVGINLFISSLRFGKPVVSLYRASLPFIGLLLVCLAVITFAPGLSMTLVRQVEGTGSVELRWARRDPAGGAGRAELSWSRRGEDSAAGWDELAAPPGEAARERADDLSLRFRPLDPADLPRLRAGQAVPCSFDLRRESESGWRLAAHWEAEIAGPGDLSGFQGEPSRLSLLPGAEPFPGLDLGPENLSASSIEVLSVEGGRLSGLVRAAIVYFPADESASEQVFDLEVSFDCPLRLDALELSTLPEGARHRRIHDVRLTVRTDDSLPSRRAFLLERTRTRPFDLYAAWSAEARSLEELAGSEADLSLLRVRLEDLGERDFPGEGAEVPLARLFLDTCTEDEVAGRIRAVLRGRGGTFDVEARFRLPARAR